MSIYLGSWRNPVWDTDHSYQHVIFVLTYFSLPLSILQNVTSWGKMVFGAPSTTLRVPPFATHYSPPAACSTRRMTTMTRRYTYCICTALTHTHINETWKCSMCVHSTGLQSRFFLTVSVRHPVVGNGSVCFIQQQSLFCTLVISHLLNLSTHSYLQIESSILDHNYHKHVYLLV